MLQFFMEHTRAIQSL